MADEEFDPTAAVRMAYAGALRMIATTLRSQAELLQVQARTLDDTAEATEAGLAPLPDRPVRLQVVDWEGPEMPADADVEPEDEEPAPVESITKDADGVFVLARDGGPVGAGMAEWLDRFDDRVRALDEFEEAVDEAAAAGLPLDEDTALKVGRRARELFEMPRQAPPAGERGQ